MTTTGLQPAPLWWRDPRVADGLQVALDHINEAREDEALGRSGWELEACEDMFKALNQLANSLDDLRPVPEIGNRRSEIAKYQVLLTRLSADARDRLVADPVVRDLALFKLGILSHSVDGMSQARPAKLSADVIRVASEDHRQFREAWQYWSETGSRSRHVAERLVSCVLVLRNNDFHGEKTRSAPRNRDVGAVVLPVLTVLLDEILDRPSRRLIAYGTLRPGRQNHGLITTPGTWRPVTVQGVLTERDALPAFVLNADGQAVDADLFESERIGEIWSALDAFEGRHYPRRLCVCNGDGIAVGNIYEFTEST